MKQSIFFLLLFNLGTNCFAQNFQLKIIGSSISETEVVDSLKYNAVHTNAKAILEEVNIMAERLKKFGYLEVQLLENSKINDTCYISNIILGKKIKFIHIYLGRTIPAPSRPHSIPSSPQLSPKEREKEKRGSNKGEGAETEKENNIIKRLIGFDKTKDTLILPYSETAFFLKSTLQKLEQKGFAFAKLKLGNIKKNNNSLQADLQFESGQQRQINEIVAKFGESSTKNSFPKGHLKQINKKYNKSTFNQDLVRKIQNDFEKFGFVNQLKTPEILFTQDTTTVYVYLEKKKSNTFDGFIGFANNDNDKLTFNGYLDLILENTIKAGEQFSLYWKSDGNNQKTFNTCIDLPYIFKTPIGLKAQISIFRQDSIFQNTKTAIDLGYFLDYKTRIYVGFQATESSDIQNTNNLSISDFKNSFVTANFEYARLDNLHTAFSKKTAISITTGFGSRATSDLSTTAGSNQQTFIHINAIHNFYLNPKNCININYQNYFIKSDTYIINELYRFGGTRSIRGFAENSFQANFMAAIITEYRYIISPELYVHTVLDYAYYEDETSNIKSNLLGTGFGIGIKTKNGNLKLTLSNGINNGNQLKFANSFLNLGYNIAF